jgi:hypothetical protein
VSGTAPQTVTVRQEYSDDECEAEVEGRAEVTQYRLSVVLDIKRGCSSSKR